jgi:hypothetical protein
VKRQRLLLGSGSNDDNGNNSSSILSSKETEAETEPKEVSSEELQLNSS